MSQVFMSMNKGTSKDLSDENKSVDQANLNQDQIQAPIRPFKGSSNNNNQKMFGPLLGLLAVVGAKFKFLIVLLKVFKFGKIGGTALSMGVMIWAYSRQYGWVFAAGFVLLILIHELGHGLAAKKIGLKVGAPVFIPFFGAFISLKEQPKTTYDEFIIGAGGPIAGTAAGILCLVASRFVPFDYAHLMLALGYCTLVMNLFNLAPIGFLDGSRMTSALLWPEWCFGLAGMLYAEYLGSFTSDHTNPIAILVLLFGFIRLIYSIYQRDKRSPSISLEERITVSLIYFSLSGFLMYGVERVWIYLT
jgi:Zn-dependent protease